MKNDGRTSLCISSEENISIAIYMFLFSKKMRVECTHGVYILLYPIINSPSIFAELMVHMMYLQQLYKSIFVHNK